MSFDLITLSFFLLFLGFLLVCIIRMFFLPPPSGG